MSTFHDYESMGMVDFKRVNPALIESYNGTAVVQWYGNIERQLLNLLKDQEKSKNYPYTDKVRKFLEIWRANEITGSINRETLEIIKSATDVLSVDNWNLDNYFSNLRDQLRKLIASEEQLPRGADMEQNDPMAGGMGGRSAPPLSPGFGPEKDEPGAGGPDIPGSDTDPAPGDEQEPGAPGNDPATDLPSPEDEQPGKAKVDEEPPFV